MKILRSTSFTIILGIIFFLILTGAKPKFANSSSGYIEFQYQGESDKPFPIIIFYTEGSLSNPLIDTVYQEFFVHKFIISEVQFKKLKTVLSKNITNNGTNDMPASYAFTIIENNNKDIFFVGNRNQIRNIFHFVSELFFKTELEKSLDILLDQTLRRIPVKNS